MSLYREPGRRRAAPILIAAAVSALLGGLAGVLISSGDEEPSLEDALEQTQEDVRPALSELELVTIEYSEAVQGGQVVAATEYEASIDHVERAEAAVEGAAPDLELLHPNELANAQAALGELSGLVKRRADPAQVNAVVARADAAIRAAAGI
jgi:hypothetical protein